MVIVPGVHTVSRAVVHVYVCMQGLVESDAELLAVELKMYRGKLDDQRSAFTNGHLADMAALQAELDGIHAQMRKLRGRYDEVLPPTPTSSPSVTTTATTT